MFGTLQNRLPQELRAAGVTAMAEANRYLSQTYLPCHNRRFSITAEGQGTAFVAFAGNLDGILCVYDERTVSHDNTVRYKGRTGNHILQIPQDRHRHRNVKAKVMVHDYPDGRMALFHGPRRLAAFGPDGAPELEPTKAAA